MKALQCQPPGGPDSLAWVEVPEPQPGPGEISVRVDAGAVSWGDVLQRDGRYPGGPEPPFTCGHDLAGEVVAIGPGVDGNSVGTPVWSVLGAPGAFAEFASGPAGWFHPIPAGLDVVTASAIGAAFLTADTALVPIGRLERGESVLVHAAAGGVGSAAVQLARAYGAGLVIGTCGSDAKAAQVVELGADRAVNYETEDFAEVVAELTDGRGVDLALESVGGEVLGKTFDCIGYLGRIVSYGAASLRTSDRLRLHTLLSRSVIFAGFTLTPMFYEHAALLTPGVERVQRVLADGRAHPLVSEIVPATEAPRAYRLMSERAITGRAVIDISGKDC
jgi:NADPH2:quinone reductase